MALRYAVAAALVAASSLPASAEFCLLDSKMKSGEPVVVELGGPRCTGGNRLVFTRRYASGAPSEEIETFITDSWPGFMGADAKCRSAAAGAKIVVDRPGSIIIGVTLGSKIKFGSHQVWAFKGSCSVFRSRLLSKTAEGKAEREDVLEAIGAGKSDMGELVDKLIELGEKPPKD
jgi:hypothetical protein